MKTDATVTEWNVMFSELQTRISLEELNRMTVNTNHSNIVENVKCRNTFIDYKNVKKLVRLERQYEDEMTKMIHVYRPNLSYKFSGIGQNGHIVVYNVSVFIDDFGDLIIPEGVSVIYSSEKIRCRFVKLPKSLSSIVSLDIECKGRLNLRNVRYISKLVVNAKELILPYTLERISSNGIKLLGRTVVKTERTPLEMEAIIGSLGINAIIDERDIKSKIFIPNRFCNIFCDSWNSDSVIIFYDINILNEYFKDEVYIKDYYPYYLYEAF